MTNISSLFVSIVSNLLMERLSSAQQPTTNIICQSPIFLLYLKLQQNSANQFPIQNSHKSFPLHNLSWPAAAARTQPDTELGSDWFSASAANISIISIEDRTDQNVKQKMFFHVSTPLSPPLDWIVFYKGGNKKEYPIPDIMLIFVLVQGLSMYQTQNTQKYGVYLHKIKKKSQEYQEKVPC